MFLLYSKGKRGTLNFFSQLENNFFFKFSHFGEPNNQFGEPLRENYNIKLNFMSNGLILENALTGYILA